MRSRDVDPRAGRGTPASPRKARTPWRAGLAAAGAGLTTGYVPTEAPAAEAQWGGDIGAIFSFAFGEGRFDLGFALEGRILHGRQYGADFLDCADVNTPFRGAIARLAVVGWERMRLMIGPQVGYTTVIGEAGVDATLGYQLGKDAGLVVGAAVGAGVSTGLIQPAVQLGHAFRRETSIGGGIRFPMVQAAAHGGCSTPGRPLRRGEGRAPLPAATLIGPAPGHPFGSPTSVTSDADVRRHAFSMWVGRARTEWASVPAFLELAEQLAAAGAPASLGARALEAAADEANHAVLATAVAARVAGGPLVGTLDSPAPDRRAVVHGEESIARLLTESWADGCLNEGGAAAAAQCEAELASDPVVRGVQRVIAADEGRHAELAWDVLSWAWNAAGARLREDLLASAYAPRAPASSKSARGDAAVADDAADALEGFGCLSPAGFARIDQEHWSRSVDRLRRLTAGLSVL